MAQRPTKQLLRAYENELRIENEREPFNVAKFNEAARKYLAARSEYHAWAEGKSERSQYETPRWIVRALGLDK